MADWRTTPGANILIAISVFGRITIIDKLNYSLVLILITDIITISYLHCSILLLCVFCIFYAIVIIFQAGGGSQLVMSNEGLACSD